jgi:hypothetical protein
MAKTETWYDTQANIAKLIIYAALLILLASLGWSFHAAWQAHFYPEPSYRVAMLSALAGIATAAFLAGMSAIIDLLIVNAEALRSK